MTTGIDFSFSRVPAAVAVAAGHRFAISYLTDLDSGHRVKQWKPEEIAAYRAAGLGVVAVWQGGFDDRTRAWRAGYDRGRRDALLAARQSAALGRPEGTAGRPVYFAIDSDVSPADLALVAKYFDGVASVFDVQNIGVYGGRRVIEWAQSSGKARWFWQTGAWSAGYRVPGIHLFQRVPQTKLGPYSVDIDEALRDDYGQWFDVPGGGSGMRLVSRAEWGARAYRLPNGATQYAGPRAGVKVHYLGTAYSDRSHDRCAAYVRSLQTTHMDVNRWSDIGYSFLVCTHGYVFEGRGLRRRNSANGDDSLNERHYAVCGLLGNTGMTQPTTAQLHGIRDAIEYCRSQGPAGSEIRGHRDGFATDCPGGALYAWVQRGAPRPATPDQPRPSVPPAPVPVPVEEDMAVLGGELNPGFEPKRTMAIPPSVPDGKRMFLNIGADGRVLGEAYAFVTGASWRKLGDFDIDNNDDLAYFELPPKTRKVVIYRKEAEGVEPDAPAAWNVEVI